jgi:chromosome transmission fidelity protein 1
MEVKVVEDGKLELPADFSFPFTPYEIQTDFMKALFLALDERKLGIFESPTGTVSIDIDSSFYVWI